jgi:dienelactone hydrolase
VNALEAVVANQGPFYGILGYSQGGAFVTTFLSQTSSATFEVALIFCGYLPTTHLGLVSRIDAAAPFENIRALVFMGTNDNIIPNDLSRDAAAKYSSATLVYDAVGHEVPWEATTSFQTVTAFITSPGQSDAADSVTSPGQKSSDHRFFGFACALCLLRVRVVSIRVHFYDARLIEYKECYAALGQSSLCFNDELFFRGVLPFALF